MAELSGVRDEADRRLGAALEARSVRDPRAWCRAHLRTLKDDDPERYREAVEYYESELLPGIAEGRLDPVDAWLEYAGRLAALRAPGRMVAVDRTGGSGGAEGADPSEALLLHLPDRPTAAVGAAMPVSAPAEMSAAQQATYDLLVEGKKQWNGPDPDGEAGEGTNSDHSTDEV